VDPQAPLLIVNAASFERLLGQVATTFEAAGRPELAESLGGQLARVNDLKGLNRNQSMGVMLYLTGFSPTTVAYVPVKNIDDLMKTVELGPVSTTKVGEDRYEVKARQQTLYVKMQGTYAFVSNDSSAVNLGNCSTTSSRPRPRMACNAATTNPRRPGRCARPRGNGPWR
jgi:hypothetical protein